MHLTKSSISPVRSRLVAAAGVSLAGTLALAGLSPVGAGPDPAAGQSGPDEPMRVIVIMESDAALEAMNEDDAPAVSARTKAAVEDRRAQVKSEHRRALDAMEEAGADVKSHRSFTGLINAMALEVPETDIDLLKQAPGVAKVVPEQRVRTTTDVSVPFVGAPEVWEQADDSGNAVRGEGVTVAVIDTGVDYNHGSLGGGFGTPAKVIGGYDFVNDDDDPMDDNGHGTHVAGIIAGDGEGDGDVEGVAPDASLTAYKVLNARGMGWESDILAALEEATDPANPDRADVVNMSLGAPGDGTDPIGMASTAAVEAGVVVVASAGNSGPGTYTIGSPGAADGVVGVGASVSGIRLPAARMVAPRDELIQTFRAPYTASPPDEPVTGEVVDVNKGMDDDYAEAGDVDGKIVAINSSIPRSAANVSPYLIEQAKKAEDLGAIAMIAYAGGSGGPVALDDLGAAGAEIGDSSVDLPIGGTESGDSFRMDKIVVLGLQELQWDRLRRDLEEGTVELEISGDDVTDLMASFSSRGPTADYRLKPDIVAPGAEIRSAWPTKQWAAGEYRLSGTSMAAPHVAGAAALVRQLRSDANAKDVSAQLIGSAHPLDEMSPTTVGSGRLDVAAAANTDLSASPAVLSLGAADLAEATVSKTGTFVIRNHGDEPATITLDAEQAGTSVGSAAVAPRDGTIAPGGELEVTLTVTADRPDDAAHATGWVVASTNSGADQVRVPYLFTLQPLVVQISPDPSAGTTEAFVWSPLSLSGPPVVTVTPPRGDSYEVTATHDHGAWYRAELAGKKAGAYTVNARATSADDLTLLGAGSFEVADGRGPSGWRPIGPNSDSGDDLATTRDDTDMVAMTQYLKAGPWTTDNQGETWEQHNRLPVAGGTGELVVSNDDADTMWYAINGETGGFFNDRLDPTYEGRILRTTDGGDSWQILDAPNAHINAFVSDRRTKALVAVMADAVAVSRDGGDNWITYPNKVSGDLLDAAVGGEDLYLANTSGVWAMRGLMAGEPSAIEQVYDGAGTYFDGIDGMVADDEVVAVLTRRDDVKVSDDDGQSWDTVYSVPDGGALDLVLRDETIMISTYRPVQHLGREYGATWSAVPQPVAGGIETDFAPWGDGWLWSSPSAGLFATDEEGEEPRRIGVQGKTAYDLAVTTDSDGEPALLAGTDSDVYSTPLPVEKVSADVSEWGLSGREAYVGTRVGQLETSPHDSRTVWKVRKDALSTFWVYRSTDGGGTWDVRGVTNEVPYDIMVSPADPDRVVVPYWSLAGTGLYVTDDAGETWRKLYHPMRITTVAGDSDEPGVLWLGTDSGLYRSDNFGETVEKVTSGRVTAIDITGSTMVIGGDDIKVSDDGGTTFTTADAGGLQMRVSDVLVSPVDSDVWYASTSSFAANGLVKGGRGVLRSTDGGHTWLNVSAGLENLAVESLEMSPDGRWLYAGTENGGVHRAGTR